MLTSPTILITGGCGFLGQHLIERLLSGGASQPAIHVLDMRSSAAKIFAVGDHPQVRVTLGVDVRQPQTLTPHFEGVDAVIHLAGLVSFAYRDRHDLMDINVAGTANVLEAARLGGVRRFIHVSSVAALGYGDDPDKPVDEDFHFDWSIARRKHKYYMLSKHEADLAVERYTQKGGRAVVVYPGLMFGPGDLANSARLIEAVRRGKIPFNMPGGTNIVDVRDVARAIAMILDQGVADGRFLLAGDNLPFHRVNSVIAQAVGAVPPRRTLPRRAGELMTPILLWYERLSARKPALTADNLDSALRFRYFDNTNAKRRLGWQPQITFEQTIRDTVAWIQANGQSA